MGAMWRSASGGWQPLALESLGDLLAAGHGVRVVSVAGGAVLLARPGQRVRVNGEPVPGGLRVLEHQDEILLADGQRLFFSAESRPEVEPFHASDSRATRCAVCRGPLLEGQAAVRCPGCSRWFHQEEAADDRPAKLCWTYSDKCRFCNHPTALAEAAQWRPAEDA
jgi:hypothetical protein